jgi:hypothetical protein
MTKRLYRVPKLPPFVEMRELDKYLFAEIPVKAEADDHCRDGEWYCHNPGCSVRHVRVQIKRTAPTPAAMHCPACARPMRFVDWLVTVPITFLEYAGEAEAANPNP